MTGNISVVICAYTEKRWNDLIAAVASVQSQTLPAKEIVVVIDHNPDLLQRAQEHLSDVIAIKNSGEKGLSGARNSGWEQAQGEIVAFLDDDAIADPNWLENLAASYSGPDIAGVGGKIVPLWEGAGPSWFPGEFNWVIGCTYFGMPMKNTQIRNVIGANMSIRRNILTAVGGFREAFGCDKDSNTSRGIIKWFNHYAGDEETELCIRVSQQLPSSVWLYASSASVQHRVSVERTRWGYFMWRCYDEGLGKASLASLHGAFSSLSTERDYTFKTLPRGVVRGLADTFLQFDLSGIRRAGAIIAGLTITTAGYLVGITSQQLSHLRPTTSRSMASQAQAERS